MRIFRIAVLLLVATRAVKAQSLDVALKPFAFPFAATDSSARALDPVVRAGVLRDRIRLRRWCVPRTGTGFVGA